MDMGWPWVRTSSPCCWWPQGTPALVGGLQQCQPSPSISPFVVDGMPGPAPGQVPVTLGGCRVTSEMVGVVGRISPTAGCRAGCRAMVSGAGWGSARSVPRLCHHPRELAGWHSLQIKRPSAAPRGAADGFRLFPCQHEAWER